MLLSRTLALAALLVALGSSQEKPSQTWTHIGDSKGADNGEVALARTPDGVLHVLWMTKHGTFDLLHNAVTAAGQASSATSPVVTGWMALNSPGLVVTKDGRPTVFLSGIRSLNANEVFSGAIAKLTGNADGTAWQLEEQSMTALRSAGASPLAAAATPDGTPVVSWFTTGALNVHVGLDPRSPDRNLQTACCAYNPNLATDATTGEVVEIWYSNATKSNGLLTQTIVPNQGDVRYLPGSATDDRNSSLQPIQRTALTARLGAPGIFSAYCTGYPSCKGVSLWRHDPPQALSIAGVVDARFVNIAAAPDQFNIWLTRVFQPLALTSSAKSFLAASGAAVHFQATDAGDPLPGVAINVAGLTATTDAEGRATIEFPKGGAPSRLVVTAAKPGYTNGSLVLTAAAEPAKPKQ